MDSIISKASNYAVQAHKNQRRKYSNQPYWHHLANVAELVQIVEHDDEMIAAAWLHDTVEDTDVTVADIDINFGADVATLVQWLTIPTKLADGNRTKRKEIDRLYIEKAPDRAKTIKLADLIDNTESIVDNDADFAKVYLQEKALMLPCLLGGSGRLMFVAELTLKMGLRKLANKGSTQWR